jgi:hypothetical protein
MHHFIATLDIIGVNPFVFVPEDILNHIFKEAGKNKGSIPIRGTVNNKPYKQTLVRYSGEWRLYINTTMLSQSPKHVGEVISITLEYDEESRELELPEKWIMALVEHPEAKIVFDALSPSKQLEIVRYLVKLKTEEAKDRNILRAIRFLLGKERFVGRDKP